MLNEGVSKNVVPPYSDEPALFKHSRYVSPPSVLKSQSIGNFALGTGANDDGLYYSDVNKVAYTKNTCNKRISNAREERLVGRPGDKHIGDRNAACNSEMCLGPYATHATVQSPHTGHNAREKE